VQTGAIVAQSEEHPTVKLISSVTGTVSRVVATRGRTRRLRPGRMTITRDGDEEPDPIPGASTTAEEIPSDRARAMLVQAGLWPHIRQVPGTGPASAMHVDPQAVVVKCVAAEPFVVRGHAVLQDQVAAFNVGLEMLQHLSSGYARQHLVLTQPSAPLAEEIREATRGKAWLKIHYAPVAYPVENDRYLFGRLFPGKAGDPEFRAWFVDAQTVIAIGACLAEGRPGIERIVAVAGPEVAAPVHVRVRVGMPLDELLEGRVWEGEHRVVRGGLLTGVLAEEEDAAVGPMDQAANVLPEGREREFMGFVRPGGDRVSYSRAFLSWLSPERRRAEHTNLRGEPRACISCGFCESVCPADIMPHWLHKCLATDRIEEAEQMGLELCVECALCSYVCPSKIELLSELRAGKQRLREERDEG